MILHSRLATTEAAAVIANPRLLRFSGASSPGFRLLRPELLIPTPVLVVQGSGAASEATEAQVDSATEARLEAQVVQETVADSEGQADTEAQAETEAQVATGAPADSEVASEETTPGVRARSAVEARAALAALVGLAARVAQEVLEALVAQTTLQGPEIYMRTRAGLRRKGRAPH